MENNLNQTALSAATVLPADDRKLWLDYLKSLNERRLQASRNSGLTSYVLLAVLGGMLYQFIPRVPSIIGNVPHFSATQVVLALEANVLLNAWITIALLVYYCAGGIEHRVAPETKRRMAIVLRLLIILVMGGLAIFQTWVGITANFPSHFVKWTVLILGFWTAANLILGARKQYKAAQRARAQKIPVPVFTASMFAPNWESVIGLGFTLSITIVSIITLLIYLKRLQNDWTLPLGAASVFLTCLVICGVLFNRALNTATSGAYETLERDILLDQLDAKEIRARFIRHTLGSETSAWLDELLSGLKAEDERLAKLYESARKRLEEVNSIDLQYRAERKSRTKNIVDDLASGIQRHKAQLENLQFQMEVFFQSHKTQREREVLERWTGDLKIRTQDAKKIVQSTRELLAQASQLIEK